MTKSCMECPDGSWFTQLLRNAKPLPVRLAQAVANTPAGNAARHAMLNRLYSGLRDIDKLRFRDELSWCRLAKRGSLEAEVA